MNRSLRLAAALALVGAPAQARAAPAHHLTATCVAQRALVYGVWAVAAVSHADGDVRPVSVEVTCIASTEWASETYTQRQPGAAVATGGVFVGGLFPDPLVLCASAAAFWADGTDTATPTACDPADVDWRG